MAVTEEHHHASHETDFANNSTVVEEGKRETHDSGDEHIEDPGKDLQHWPTRESMGVHEKMDARLFFSLIAMSFLWVGSQIPLYLFGSILPLIYSDIGGADRYVWMVIGYLIPCAGICPFVGALSDMFGRRNVGALGQLFLIIGPTVTSTANTMNTAIAGMVISGAGAGLNELIALAGTGEMVPVAKRGAYVGLIVITILPFCPSALWAQLIAQASNWRYVGILVGAWNFIGLVLLVAFYRDPRKREGSTRSRREILREVDFVGGFLSISGVLLFMMGLQWGETQYLWSSTHVLVPFCLGAVLIIAFFVWELRFAPFPMAPRKLFSRSKRTMILTLLITFWSGGNFFVLLLFWPTQVYTMFSPDPLKVGIRTLPIGFGIIGGAVIGLVLISILKGRTKFLMIFSCALMTAGTGAMSVGKIGHIDTLYGIITIASIGVGLVIIPCSILCQICCPSELIGTITAITLSIRYIGGAVGFAVYYNVFYHKLETYLTADIPPVIVAKGISIDPVSITNLITLAAQSQFANLKEYIATDDLIFVKQGTYDLILNLTHQSFALAYRWPYWISIAFGGVCVLCSLGLKDVRDFM